METLINQTYKINTVLKKMKVDYNNINEPFYKNRFLDDFVYNLSYDHIILISTILEVLLNRKVKSTEIGISKLKTSLLSYFNS